MNLCAEARQIQSIPRSTALVVLTTIFCSSLLATQPANAVRGEMLVTTDWLATHLDDSDLIVLCIVDDDQFYASGHIPGARMIRASEIVTSRADIPNELPPVAALKRVFERAGVNDDSRIILYGERSGLLAARLYFTLDYLGRADRAALLDGGIEKWRAEKRAESTAVPRQERGKFNVRANPQIAVTLAETAKYALAPDSLRVLMDARPKAEYLGEKRSEDVLKAGHIPGAVGLYWRNLVEDDSASKLKSVAELERLFRASGALPGKEIITYCRTGMQSSFSYFVAKYLGYETRMFDGSFYEWSRSTLPVEH